jgi:hypothetical protein
MHPLPRWNDDGEPCGYCNATGEVYGLAAFATKTSALRGALVQVIYLMMAIGGVVLIALAITHAGH